MFPVTIRIHRPGTPRARHQSFPQSIDDARRRRRRPPSTTDERVISFGVDARSLSTRERPTNPQRLPRRIHRRSRLQRIHQRHPFRRRRRCSRLYPSVVGALARVVGVVEIVMKIRRHRTPLERRARPSRRPRARGASAREARRRRHPPSSSVPSSTLSVDRVWANERTSARAAD